LRNNDAREKEISPKLAIYSVLQAGSAVNNCRTVSIDNPGFIELSYLIWEEDEFRVMMTRLDLSSPQVFFVFLIT
jgi:hypothetical protein